MVKSTLEISKNFVAFSECMNFPNYSIFFQGWKCRCFDSFGNSKCQKWLFVSGSFYCYLPNFRVHAWFAGETSPKISKIQQSKRWTANDLQKSGPLCILTDGNPDMAISWNVAPTGKAKKSLMDANTLIFGGISLISLAIFFYLGRFRASTKQRDREDRIDWSSRKFSLWRIFLYSLVAVGGIVLLTQFI